MTCGGKAVREQVPIHRQSPTVRRCVVPNNSKNFFQENRVQRITNFGRPIQASQVALVVQNLPANARDLTRDPGLVPGLGRSTTQVEWQPIQYSYLENPTDRGAWRAIVHGVD